MDVVHEDDGLWDELSHQQSREIEQHRARASLQQHEFSSGSLPANGSSAADNIQRVARRAADEVERFSKGVYQSTVQVYRETAKRQQQRHRHAYHTVSNPDRGGYLDDFGLSTRDDPLLSSKDEEDPTIISPEVNGNFVFLPNLRRRPTADGWGAVSNLDMYFSSLYNYYYHRGVVPILGKGVVELITLFLTLYLSIFLFAHVNWRKLSTCIDETTCHGDFFRDYYVAKPMSLDQSSTVWKMLVRLYFLIFLAYGLFSMWSFWQNLQGALRAKQVFEDRLGLPAHKLEGGAVDWDRDVICKLQELQESGEYRITIQQRLDAMSVTHRILRKENFFVALFNQNLLDLSVPFFGHGFFCASLEWSVYYCIFNFMFNHKFNIRPAFYLEPSALKRRFAICGIAHAVFIPFLLFFTMLHFGLRNAYDWKSTKQYLGPREWSLTAKWTFREFNELPHFFERRLAHSYEAAEDYLKLFGQNEMMTAAGHILVFVGGSIGAVLFVFAAINDAILLHVKIYDWNLLWYAGIAGIVYSAGKSMLPNGDDARVRNVRNIYAERDAALAKVANHTHYYPDIWKRRGWDKINHKTFSMMFQFKGQLFFREALSLILAPYILCVSLPRCAEGICKFILACKTEVPGAGDVCGFATFDFDAYGDETWEGRTLGVDANNPEGISTHSELPLGAEELHNSQFPKPKAKHGKMEKSFFSFKSSHPSWKVSESGQHLVDRVEKYLKEETAAAARERQLHVEAAVRQLDTLARMEQNKQTMFSRERAMASNMNGPIDGRHSVNDSYIPRVQPPVVARTGIVPVTATTEQSFTQARAARAPSAPPPAAAFSQFSLSPSSNDHDAVNSQTDEVEPAPFALGQTRESIMSVSPVLSSRPPTSSSNATLTGASLALSADMLRLLNMSSLETGSLLEDPPQNQNEERQYMWLERYHAHLAAEQRDHGQTVQPQRDVEGSSGPENIV